MLRPVHSDATQLNSTSSWVELSCVAIDTLTDATQLSPTIGNATESTGSRRSELSGDSCSRCERVDNSTSSWVELCRYKRAFRRVRNRYRFSVPIAGRPSCVIGITRHTPGTYRCSGVYDISVTKIKRLLTETRSSAIAATALVTIQD